MGRGGGGGRGRGRGVDTVLVWWHELPKSARFSEYRGMHPRAGLPEALLRQSWGDNCAQFTDFKPSGDLSESIQTESELRPE